MRLLAGWEVTMEQIVTFPVSKIDAIEVLTSCKSVMYKGVASKSSIGATYGNADYGVINMLTKAGNPTDDYSQEKVANATNFKLAGYSKASEFYSPRYDVPEAHHTLPDYRNTIY